MDKEHIIGTPRKESNWATRIGAKNQTPETPSITDEQFQNKDDITTLKEYLEKTHAQAAQTDYFPRRGISSSTIERLGLGYDPAFRTKEGVEFVTWQAVIIPTSEYSYTVRNTELSAELHNRIRKKGPSTIFNPAALRSGNPVFIVEGEIDAISLIEAGAEALALGSAANINQLIKALEQYKLGAGIILSLDNDDQGRRTTAELSQRLKLLNINHIEANVCGEYKDPNEALTMARGQFIQAVQATQESLIKELHSRESAERNAYMDNCMAGYLRDITGDIGKNTGSPCIPTGFGHLNKLLDGGLYEGLYVIGSLSSMGTTAFALQIVDQIAAQAGNDVLVFSLDNPRDELLARSLSRLTFTGGYEKGQMKTAREITASKYQPGSPGERDIIKSSIECYREYARHIYISEGRGDVGPEQIRDTLAKHIQFTGNKPAILIDCLQLLAPHDPRNSGKQNLCKALLELKRISRDYRLPVLTISYFALHSYASRAFDYSSDVVIGLYSKDDGDKALEIGEIKNKDPRKIDLKILKNRHGTAGNILSYNYYPMFNCFTEALNE